MRTWAICSHPLNNVYMLVVDLNNPQLLFLRSEWRFHTLSSGPLTRVTEMYQCFMDVESLLVFWKHIQFSSVAQSCPTLCNPMNRSTPGLPVDHQLPEFTQTHIHQVSDALILEPKKIKSVTVSVVSQSICYEVMGLNAMIFILWMLSFKPAFHSPL